jgi:hypothetical protein
VFGNKCAYAKVIVGSSKQVKSALDELEPVGNSQNGLWNGL